MRGQSTCEMVVTDEVPGAMVRDLLVALDVSKMLFSPEVCPVRREANP